MHDRQDDNLVPGLDEETPYGKRRSSARRVRPETTGNDAGER